MKFMGYIKKFRNKYITYFDLGSTGKEGIHYLIDSLARNDKLVIAKIFLSKLNCSYLIDLKLSIANYKSLFN